MFLLFCLFITLFGMKKIGSRENDINDDQRVALCDIYHSTEGEKWHTGRWCTNETKPYGYCSWYGITCHDNLVTKIDLEENNVRGDIPSSLGNLRALKSLSLYDNAVTSLPDTIGKLSELSELQVSHNGLKALPDSIGKLTKLTLLSANSNFLTELSDSISELSNLINLWVFQNDMVEFPECVLGLSNLQSLSLQSNKLESLPHSLDMSKLTSLRELRLFWNKIDADNIDWICSLKSLKEIYLQHNKFKGSIPDCFDDMPNIHMFDFSVNSFSGVLPLSLNRTFSDPGFGFDASGNDLNGVVPFGYCELKYCDLRGNPLLKFPFPDCCQGRQEY